MRLRLYQRRFRWVPRVAVATPYCPFWFEWVGYALVLWTEGP